MPWVDVRCVQRQERDLDMPVQSVQILAHETAAMRPLAIPDAQQRLLQVGFERLEEADEFVLLAGLFLRAGQVPCFQLRTASSLRSMARFSGFCTLKPKTPKIR